MEGLGDVMLKELEIRISQQVADVLHSPCKEIVHTQHLIAIGKKPVAEVRANEARTACDQC